jgi:hypothetical protein
MKHTKQTQNCVKDISRRLFSKSLTEGLILLTSVVVLACYPCFAQGADDALFIDEKGNVGFGGTGALTLPSGSTEERPASPQHGALRFNTTTKTVEVFFEGLWFKIETAPYIGGKGNIKVFEYQGVPQEFCVPKGVKKILVKAWGAGGAGGTGGREAPEYAKRYGAHWGYGSYGGGGGFSRGVLNVTPDEKLTIVVGGGGLVHQTDVGYGGGGPVCAKDQCGRNWYCGGGGGRSAVETDKGEQLIVAGGGGGGGSTRSKLFAGKGNSGGAGGGEKGEDGYSQYDGKFRFGGKGGGQDFEGAGGDGGGGPGNKEKGGTIQYQSYGGGGGGGYKGGGSGGYSESNTMGGGGGGSGYIINDASYAITITGTQRQCPMQNDLDYFPEVGIGGQDGKNGGNGLVVIRW